MGVYFFIGWREKLERVVMGGRGRVPLLGDWHSPGGYPVGGGGKGI